ncbi:MAG: glycosyltransferase family 87 protein [Thermoleophilia bacterium]
MNIFSKIALWYSTRWFFSLAVIAGYLCFVLILQELSSLGNGGINFFDFQVYYRAGARLLDGENLYRAAEDGHFIFKYSPTAAILFVPFSLLPLWLAKIFYWLFICAGIVSGFYFALAIVAPGFKHDPTKANGVLLIAALLMWPHLWTEFAFGQINYLLMVAFVCVAFLFIRKKTVWSSALLAFTLFIKPYGLAFLPYFIIKKRFRDAGWFLFFTGFFFLLPAVFFRSGEFLSQQRHWISTVFDELGVKQGLLEAGNHTVYSMLARYSPLAVLPSDSPFFKVFPFVVVLAIGCAVLWLFVKDRGVRNPEALDFALMLALMPLISYTTDNAFCFTALAVVLLIDNFDRLGRVEKVVLIPGLLFVSFDLFFLNRYAVGRSAELFDLGNTYSLLGIGTVILVIIMTRCRLKANL